MKISVKKFWGGLCILVGLLQGSYAIFKDVSLAIGVIMLTFSTGLVLYGIKKFGGQGEQK